MLIRKSKSTDLCSSEITPEALYLDRRRFLAGGAAAALGLTLPEGGRAAEDGRPPVLDGVKSGPYGTSEEKTGWDAVTSYNNFYELGLGKDDPKKNAHRLETRPWTVEISGEVEAPRTIGIEDILSVMTLEERVYRLRCVEAWSMVIPWVGFPLADLLAMAKPTSKAKYVAFETLYDPKQLPGQRSRVLDWPYREGLRIDEAMHPLTILAVGLYGRVLPNQNGAPLRLVVPWKYGFKSIKSIVSIKLTEREPRTSWNMSAPQEYGFYANVNPEVDHPRWSQARERRVGDFFKRDTLMFNGYGEEVAHLYDGMNLRRYY